MRNTLPPLVYVQNKLTSLAGNVRIGVEASNASIPGDDKYHPNSGNTLTLPPLDRYGAQRRWLRPRWRLACYAVWLCGPTECNDLPANRNGRRPASPGVCLRVTPWNVTEIPPALLVVSSNAHQRGPPGSASPLSTTLSFLMTWL